MLSELITKYKSLKINMISKLGESSEGINDELDFLDDAIIGSKINYIKKICRLIDDDIEMSEDEEQIKFLVQKRKEFIYELALLASNSFRSVEFCMSILDENNVFQKCLQALIHYENGDRHTAKRLFDEFFKSNKYMLQHYLISKVYGELLYEEHDYLNAAAFFRKAVEKRPEEIKLHIMLKNIYHKLNDEILLNQEVEIINLLGEGECNE